MFYHRLGCLAVYRDTGIKWSRKIQVHVHALLFVVHYTSDVLIRDKERLRYLIICLSYSDDEKSTILKCFEICLKDTGIVQKIFNFEFTGRI